MQAARSVRKRFTAEIMEKSFRTHYHEMMREDKQLAPFRDVFGATPDEWFLSCQGDCEMFKGDGDFRPAKGSFSSFGLLEKTKGSVFHFLEYFPKTARLQAWAASLEVLR